MPRIFLLLFLLPVSTIAQQKVNLILFGGFSNYSGDIQEKRFSLDQSKGAFSAGLSYEIMPKLVVKGMLSMGKIGADDKYSDKPKSRERNLNFKSNIYEASLVADYSLFELESRKLTPYIFAGIAAFGFNPYTYDTLSNKVFLRDLGTEGQGLLIYPDRKPYKLVQMSVPFGIGFRFRITNNAYLGYEIGMRKTFTDYLDDVSRTYADEAALASNRGSKAVELAFRSNELKDVNLDYPAGGTVRGGPNYKDWYYFSGITLSIGLFNSDMKLFSKKDNRGRVDCPGRVL